MMRDDGRGKDRGKNLNPDELANQMLEFSVRASGRGPDLRRCRPSSGRCRPCST